MSDGTFYWRKYGSDRGTLPEGETTIRFDSGWEGDSKPPKDALSVFVHNYLAAGDYSNDGGIVRSNVNAFREQISDDWLGQLFWEIVGGHGYFGIAVRSDVLDEDSALYAAGEEELIDAANSIREIIDSLDSYPVLDESGHSEIEQNQQQEQFPEAATDIYVSEHDGPRAKRLLAATAAMFPNGGRTRSFAELIAAVFGGDLPAEARDRLVDDWGDHLDGIQALYYGLADMFSIYPETEGGGDDIAILFRMDKWCEDLLDSVDALRGPGENPFLPAAVPILGGMIVDGIFAEKPYDHFSYNSKVYNLVRTGREVSRMDATEYAIFADAVSANPGRGILLALDGKLITTAKAGPLAGVRRKRR